MGPRELGRRPGKMNPVRGGKNEPGRVGRAVKEMRKKEVGGATLALPFSSANAGDVSQRRRSIVLEGSKLRTSSPPMIFHLSFSFIV